MTYKDIIKEVSKITGIPTEVVDKTYKAFWLYIRDSIQKLPLKEELTEDEFLTLRTNYNIPSLGKLTCIYDRYKGVISRFKYIKELRNKNEKVDQSKTDV